MKNKRLLPILLSALFLVGCTTTGKSSSEPLPPSQSGEQQNYAVAIANKDELAEAWYTDSNQRSLTVTLTPEANALAELTAGNLTVSSSDPTVVSVTGLAINPLKAGEATITVSYHGVTDTVKVTVIDGSAKARYGTAHEGTAEDPFTNEDALLVAKHADYEGQVFYVKGTVDRFYYAPGTNVNNGTAFYLTAATENGEQFEIFKCFKSDSSQLSDDDIWVGGEVTVYGAFTKYNSQYETSSAVFVKCDGTKPAPRQTVAKTFAEVLAVGVALKDGDSTYDYYKFEGYVTKKDGNNFFLTASKGEAIVSGKSDEAHGARDIYTNAIELYGAGKVAELSAKLLENAKVEVTMIVKNYHGTVENGVDLKDADVTVKEAGTAWAVPEPAVASKTLAEFIALENSKAKAYNVTATVKSWKNATADKDKYGNMVLTDGTNDLVIYGASATATALAWDNSSAYAFTNPQDFLTNEVTAALNVGDDVTMKLIRADYTKDGTTTIQGTGIITKVKPAGAQIVDEDVVLKYSGSTTTNMAETGNAENLGLDASIFTVNAGKGETANFPGLNKAGDIRLYSLKSDAATGKGAYFVVSVAEGYKIKSITVDFKQQAQDAVVYAGDAVVTGADGVYAINGSSFKIENGYKSDGTANTQVQINKITISIGPAGASAEKSVRVSESVLSLEENKVYVKVSGTAANYAAGEFKWAWGIKVNGDNGAFVNGKATPDAADYKAETLGADGAFTVKFCLSDIENLKSGDFYRIYGGTPESYGDIAFTDSQTGAKDADRNYYLRNDQNGSLVFDMLPPVALTKASVVNVTADDIPTGSSATAGAYLKFGGANAKNLTADDIAGWRTGGKLKAMFQRVIQNDVATGFAMHSIQDSEMFWKVEGDEVYFYLYIGFMEDKEGWQTHFDMLGGNEWANCNMGVVLTGDVEYTIGGKIYTVFADSSKGSSAGDYYGCLGVHVAAD